MTRPSFFEKGCIEVNIPTKKHYFRRKQRQTMRLFLTNVFITCVLFSSQSQSQKLPLIKKGYWTGSLELNKQNNLPFKFEVSGKKRDFTITVINGEEMITLEKGDIINDSIHFSFPSFNSKLILHKKGRKKLIGYWQNLNKGIDYKIPFRGKYGYKTRFPISSLPETFPYLDGKWETTFEPRTDGAYKAIGIFHQHENKVDGTFLTETGDFRYMEGNVTNDSLFLSCFDGSHAFLLKGRIDQDSLKGQFYSGKHWKSEWEARCNEAFTLTNPDSLTYLVTEEPFTFTLKDLQGKNFTYPNEQFSNKVTIIQIMGTWCPNCMDETEYFNQLYKKYHDQGLEIISVGYEVGSSFEEHSLKIKKLKEKYNLPFLFLVGGAANKGLASEHFRMLNQIISFPTAIFIGKDGVVRKIHTGFNGPGTGEYYLEYTKETESFINSLLEEK